MNKLHILGAVAISLVVTSCDSYLDINTNPNQPQAGQVTSSMIMPAVEMNLASSYGNFMRIAGGYHAQQYAQQFGTSNYVDYSAFYMSPVRSSGNYTQLMQRVLANAQTIIEKSAAEQDWGTHLAATTLRAFTFAALVDCYGEVPYAEAFNQNNTSPHFDSGKTIYAGVIAELDAALAKATKKDQVCNNFLYPGQNAEVWIQFANSLKLRLLTRGGAALGMQSALDELMDDNHRNFITSDVEWAGCWNSESGGMSPFYAEEFATNWGSTQVNVVPNIALLGTMMTDTYSDPRVGAFFKTGSNGKYNGYISSNTQIIQGTVDANGATCDANYFSRPVASFDMPVVILSLSDVEFYQAEYYARKNDPINAADHYAAAVAANFEKAGVNGADDYLANYPYDQDKWAEVIGVAKWVANAGFDPFEAWCELRRLDYPAMSDQNGRDFDNDQKLFDYSSYKPGTIYTPKNVRSEVGEGHLIERWPYPEASTSRNSNSPKFPGHTTPVFWGE